MKKMLVYYAGTIFGKPVNVSPEMSKNQKLLASSLLAIMVVCLLGGPKFLSKMQPVTKLKADYLHDQFSTTITAIESNDAKVTAIIYDGNRVNQKFTYLFDTVSDRPWITIDDIFLLYDYVHLFKNIRSMWITEAELHVTYNGRQ